MRLLAYIFLKPHYVGFDTRKIDVELEIRKIEKVDDFNVITSWGMQCIYNHLKNKYDGSY